MSFPCLTKNFVGLHVNLGLWHGSTLHPHLDMWIWQLSRAKVARNGLVPGPMASLAGAAFWSYRLFWRAKERTFAMIPKIGIFMCISYTYKHGLGPLATMSWDRPRPVDPHNNLYDSGTGCRAYIFFVHIAWYGMPWPYRYELCIPSTHSHTYYIGTYNIQHGQRWPRRFPTHNFIKKKPWIKYILCIPFEFYSISANIFNVCILYLQALFQLVKSSPTFLIPKCGGRGRGWCWVVCVFFSLFLFLSTIRFFLFFVAIRRSVCYHPLIFSSTSSIFIIII